MSAVQESKRQRAELDTDSLLRLAGFLDLTSLNDADTEHTVASLCERAKRFNVAAVCIYPKFVAKAKSLLSGSGIRIATVANFPHGGDDIESVVNEVISAKADEADEIDVVLPYRRLITGDDEFCKIFLAKVVKASEGKTLKVIIESGELKDAALIQEASRLCIDAGVDFIKTSTGKTKVSATKEAAEAMLSQLKANNRPEAGKHCGLKVSGGIRTVEDAQMYVQLFESRMTEATPSNFRIGASGLLSDIEARLSSTENAASKSGSSTY